MLLVLTWFLLLIDALLLLSFFPHYYFSPFCFLLLAPIFFCSLFVFVFVFRSFNFSLLPLSFLPPLNHISPLHTSSPKLSAQKRSINISCMPTYDALALRLANALRSDNNDTQSVLEEWDKNPPRQITNTKDDPFEENKHTARLREQARELFALPEKKWEEIWETFSKSEAAKNTGKKPRAE